MLYDDTWDLYLETDIDHDINIISVDKSYDNNIKDYDEINALNAFWI